MTQSITTMILQNLSAIRVENKFLKNVNPQHHIHLVTLRNLYVGYPQGQPTS